MLSHWFNSTQISEEGIVRRLISLAGLLLLLTGCIDSGVDCEYSCTQDQAVYQDGVSECTDAAWNQCECVCP